MGWGVTQVGACVDPPSGGLPQACLPFAHGIQAGYLNRLESPLFYPTLTLPEGEGTQIVTNS